MADLRFFTDDMVFTGELHSRKDGLPWLLMLHGFMGSGELFSHLIPDLKNVCNPLTIDLAGHGRSDQPDDPDAFLAKRQVEQLRSIIERISPEPLYGYGYSMGGRLLLQLIITHPQLFSGAIVESSHCGITDALQRHERRDSDEARAKQIEEDFLQFTGVWSGLPLFAGTPPEHKKRALAVMRKQAPSAMAASLRRFGAGIMPPVCEKLRNLSLPLYLVAGENDTKYVDRMAEMASLAPPAEFGLVSGAGHRVHAERPEELTELIKTFLSKHHV